jgi:hypothetical protein
MTPEQNAAALLPVLETRLAAAVDSSEYRDDITIRCNRVRADILGQLYRIAAKPPRLTDPFMVRLLASINDTVDVAIADAQLLPPRPNAEFGSRPSDLQPWWR